MLTSEKALYSDKDPAGREVGRILPETDPEARFTICGAGGVISDELAAKFGDALKHHEGVSETTVEEIRARVVRNNLATYEENAKTVGGPAHKGIPGAESNPTGVKPEQQEKAAAALDSEAEPATVAPSPVTSETTTARRR